MSSSVNQVRIFKSADPVFQLSCRDEISTIHVGSRLFGTNYSFGEQREAGGEVQAGQTGTIGFWKGNGGQKLNSELNGSSKSTLLGDYLVTTYSNLFGSLADKSNDQVSSYYNTLFKDKAKRAAAGDARKLEVEVLSLALATYVTDQNFVQLQYDRYSADHIARDASGSVIFSASLVDKVTSRGFLVTDGGVGVATYDVGKFIGPYQESNVRAAFNLNASDSTVLTIADILRATNALTSDGGDFYDLLGNGLSHFESMLRDIANDVYTDINESGSN